MTSVVQQRWATRQLVGDRKHAQIVRVRSAWMNRGYLDTRRIDDGSTPFNGSPIFPVLINGGHNHSPWQGEWVVNGPWVELPSVQSTKWSRSFDPQTGGTQGAAILTVIMDNIAFPEEHGIAGLYHAISRGYYSPTRGYVAPGRQNVWPRDMGNDWENVLDGGYQIELWEGYGSGADIELLDTLDPDTNSYAPTSGALDRTFTGIIMTCDSESFPDQITITAQDFGIFLTDMRLIGRNKAPECRSPITFADRRQAQGEKKISGPYHVSEGGVSEDGAWVSDPNGATGQWIDLDLPQGYYEDFFVAPVAGGADLVYVSLYMGNGTGLCSMDRAHPLPKGQWVTLTGPGTGTTPSGTPYMFSVQNMPVSPAHRWYLGHGFDCPAGSKLRLTIAPQGALLHFYAYRFNNTITIASPQGGGQGWLLVDDAADVIRQLFIWLGFKEWYVEDFNWSLWKPALYGEDKFFMDVINEALQSAAYIFYMAPPTNDDRSLGVPHMEHIHALDFMSNPVLEVRDTDMVESLHITTDLDNLPQLLRYRGTINTKIGVQAGQDLSQRVQALYFPPWSGYYNPVGPGVGVGYMGWTLGVGNELPGIGRLAGVARYFTETMGNTLPVALTSEAECLFACILASIQYALNMRKGEFQIPGLSRLNLNDTISVVEEATATNSRMWVTGVSSEHVNGGADTQGHWTMTISGSFIDNPEMAALAIDHDIAYQAAQPYRAAWSG